MINFRMSQDQHNYKTNSTSDIFNIITENKNSNIYEIKLIEHEITDEDAADLTVEIKDQIKYLTLQNMSNMNVFFSELQDSTNLKEVTFIDTQFNPKEHIELFNSISKIKSIHSISFHNCRFNNLESTLQKLSNLNHLNSLTIINSSINHEDFQNIAKYLPNLTELLLDDNNINLQKQENGVFEQIKSFIIGDDELFINLQKMNNLRKLSLCGNDIGKVETEFLNFLSHMNNIQELFLNNVKISNKFIEKIAEFANSSKSLRILMLESNEISDKSALKFDQILENNQILVSLQNNQLTDDSGGKLAKHVGNELPIIVLIMKIMHNFQYMSKFNEISGQHFKEIFDILSEVYSVEELKNITINQKAISNSLSDLLSTFSEAPENNIYVTDKMSTDQLSNLVKFNMNGSELNLNVKDNLLVNKNHQPIVKFENDDQQFFKILLGGNNFSEKLNNNLQHARRIRETKLFELIKDFLAIEISIITQNKDTLNLQIGDFIDFMNENNSDFEIIKINIKENNEFSKLICDHKHDLQNSLENPVINNNHNSRVSHDDFNMLWEHIEADLCYHNQHHDEL